MIGADIKTLLEAVHHDEYLPAIACGEIYFSFQTELDKNVY